MADASALTNPFHPLPSPPASRGLTERDFAAVFSAAEFAETFALYFDTTVTISWRLMGPEVERDVPAYFVAFTKCLRDWLEQRCLPVAWIYAHECGATVDSHTHLCVFVPGVPADSRPDLQKLYRPDTAPDYRGEFRAWARGWPERQVGRRTPNAIRVRGPKKETPWLHWLTTSYLLKGYDCRALVQSARNSPDGRPIYLGDLIAWPWRDPGPVSLKQRVGVSRSLGPDRRALGVPGGLIICSGKGRSSCSVTPFPILSLPAPDPPFARSMRMAFAMCGGSIRRRSMTGSRVSRACLTPSWAR